MLIFALVQRFSTKTCENDYFDQRLGCAAPKRWSKYTTEREREMYLGEKKREKEKKRMENFEGVFGGVGMNDIVFRVRSWSEKV